MTADAAVASLPLRGSDARQGERRFFSGMAVAAALTVFAGFAPSYYLRALTGRSTFSGGALSPLLHVHGLLFTAWIALFVVQVRLVAARRIAVHRRLGYAAAALAAAMVVAGFLAAVDAARRGAAPPGIPALVFLAVPMADLVIFSTLVGLGIALRRRPDAHRRVMLVSTIAILTPAIARLPGVMTAGPLAFFALTDLFVVVAVVHDRATRGHVHPAYWTAGGLLLASQVGRLAISGSATWLAFAAWLTR